MAAPPRTHFKAPEGRYELVCERAPGLMPFNPSRSTRVTLATPGCSPVAEAAARGERGNDDESPSSSSQLPPRRSPRDEFLIFNVGDALHVAPLFQIDGHPWRCLVFDGREGNGTAFVPPSSSLSFLRGTTPVCHAWRPLPPALRGKEPDVIVGLAGGACVLLSLELELGEAARVSRGGGRNRGDGDGGGDGEVKNNNFHSCASPSCSSPVAAQVLWPPPPLVLGGAARSPEDSSDFVAVSVSPSLPSRVVAVAWAPGSRAVVVHACGLVAVHEPPWRLERADEEEEEETEEEEGEGRRRTASGNGAFFEAVRATVTTPSPSTSQGGDDGGTDINVDTSSPASSSFLTATGTTTAGSSPPGGVGNQQLRASSTSPGGGGGIGAAAAAGLSAAAAAHATTPPTPPTPPSRRMTQSDFENSEREERQRLFARPAVRTFSVVTDLDEEEGGDEREASGRRRRTTKSKKAKKKKSVVSRSSIIAAAALSPDGTLLATAGRDGVARVHSLATGRLVAGFSAYYGALHAVAWSPDGAAIAAGGEDDSAAVFALGELRCGLAWASGAESWVSALAFDPRGGGVVDASSTSNSTSRSYRLAVGAQDCCLGLHDVAAPDDDFAAGLAPLSPRAGTVGGRGGGGGSAARSMFADADGGSESTNTTSSSLLSLRLASAAGSPPPQPPSPTTSLIAPAPASSEMTFVPAVARAAPAHSEPLSDVAFSASTTATARGSAGGGNNNGALVTADAGGCVRVWARPARVGAVPATAPAATATATATRTQQQQQLHGVKRSAPRAAPPRERADSGGGGEEREEEERHGSALDLMSL